MLFNLLGHSRVLWILRHLNTVQYAPLCIESCKSQYRSVAGPLPFIDDSFLNKPKQRVKQQKGTSHGGGRQQQRLDVVDLDAEANKEQSRLTRVIKECKQPAALLDFLRANAAQLNPKNIGAAATALAHMAEASQSRQGKRSHSMSGIPSGATESHAPSEASGTTTSSQAAAWLDNTPSKNNVSHMEDRMVFPAALMLLARAAQHQLHGFEARQLSNTCWGAAKLVSVGAVTATDAAALCKMLLEHACQKHAIAAAAATELSLLAWSAYIMRFHDDRLLQNIAATALRLPMGQFSDNDITNILVIFAAAKSSEPRLFQAMCAELLGSPQGPAAPCRLAFMAPRHVHKLAFACAATKYHHAGFTAAIAARSQQVLDHYEAIQVCGLMSSLLALDCTDLQLFKQAASRIEAALRSGRLSQPLHVAQVMAALEERRLLQADWTAGLMQAALPTLLKCSSVKDRVRATMILAGQLEAGNQEVRASQVLSMYSELIPHLQHVPPALLVSLITGLPAVVSKLTEAADIKVVTNEQGKAAAAGDAGAEQRPDNGSTQLSSFVVQLRSIAIARLGEISMEDRPAVLKALLHVADHLDEQAVQGQS